MHTVSSVLKLSHTLHCLTSRCCWCVLNGSEHKRKLGAACCNVTEYRMAGASCECRPEPSSPGTWPTTVQCCGASLLLCSGLDEGVPSLSLRPPSHQASMPSRSFCASRSAMQSISTWAWASCTSSADSPICRSHASYRSEFKYGRTLNMVGTVSYGW